MHTLLKLCYRLHTAIPCDKLSNSYVILSLVNCTDVKFYLMHTLVQKKLLVYCKVLDVYT